ncbi:MAG: response regulator transcription factor [Lachnospiraceae bacterium]|nr:response regulator transcription factor [Lachnospiraceae bacterium]
MINVMLLDDHKIFRESLKLLLETNKNFKVVFDASDEAGFIKGLRYNDVDIILLDITMPGRDGFYYLDFIRKKNVNVKVIMLTMHIEVEYLVKATEMNVDGYLLKSAGSEELFRAIYDVYNGEDYIQPDLIPYLNNYLINIDSDKEKIKLLTARELELLAMIASGRKNIEIATSMNISERTVKNHLSHIFDKLEVSDRTQAAVFALKNNIL